MIGVTCFELTVSVYAFECLLSFDHIPRRFDENDVVGVLKVMSGFNFFGVGKKNVRFEKYFGVVVEGGVFDVGKVEGVVKKC